MNKKGFTLAEVLITLGIIGVVAALTIPTLMQNYQRMMYVTGLKKAYAEITEALKLMANDYGCPNDLKCTGLFSLSVGGDWAPTNNILGPEFVKYFKVVKICEAGATDNKGCFSDSVSEYYDGSSPRKNLVNTDAYEFITADGFSIALENHYCGTDLAPNKTNLNINQICGNLTIDVNGLKGPNNFGRDIFLFSITNGKGPALYPFGGSESIGSPYADGWVNDSGQPVSCYEDIPTGYNCTGRVMEEGWQMKYDNPKVFVFHGGGGPGL